MVYPPPPPQQTEIYQLSKTQSWWKDEMVVLWYANHVMRVVVTKPNTTEEEFLQLAQEILVISSNLPLKI